MKSLERFVYIVIICILIFCIITSYIAGFILGKCNGYKNACMDFYTGILQIEQIKKGNVTVEWKTLQFDPRYIPNDERNTK